MPRLKPSYDPVSRIPNAEVAAILAELIGGGYLFDANVVLDRVYGPIKNEKIRARLRGRIYAVARRNGLSRRDWCSGNSPAAKKFLTSIDRWVGPSPLKWTKEEDVTLPSGRIVHRLFPSDALLMRQPISLPVGREVIKPAKKK